ncbi:MAG: NYN domain-containing protein [Simplicispira sp.]|uniref:NYN domain-containing protein n=1 Tax=Simplicispira sp. TaxID=2015802 RepID=UPI002590C904|nr:NYN domain-containing protein [Simplicispira sp.]MDD2692942.1 NYN domain-containing protein [Simplicispira sp.]
MALPGEGAVGGLQAAFLIDADNFSDSVALNAAWLQVQARTGRVAVCRAYGGAQRLHTLATVWSSLGARTFPNLALEKNTTDAALIADAVALHFQQGVRLFAIASGDADFAPLAVRLREWGCEVWCFAMESTLFAGAQAYYDRVVRFAPSPVANAEPPASKPPFSAVVAAAAPAVTKPVVLPVPPAVAKNPPLAPRPAPAAPAPAPALVPASVTAKPPALPEEVARILKAIPALRETPQRLSEIVPVLRQKNILNQTKSTAFFARHAEHFKLSPVHQPTQLTYVPARVVPAAPVRPVVVEAPVPAVKAATPAVLSWTVTGRRKTVIPLSAQLHGLRSVLVQLALHRVTLADVLLAVPELLRGQPCALSAVAGRLRERGLLRSGDSALRILERHPGSFVIEMRSMPQAVIYLR